MDSLEKSPIAGPIMTLSVKGMDVQVYAGNPDRKATFEDAKPWHIVAGARLVKPSDSPLFDPLTSEVTAAFEIIGPSHFEESDWRQIQTAILSYYTISDGSIRPESVATTFIPVEDFEIWFGKSNERKVKEDVKPGSTIGTISFAVKIADKDELDDLKAGKLYKFNVTFVASYLMQTTARVSVSVSTVQAAIADAVDVSAFRQGQDYHVAALEERNIKSKIHAKFQNNLTFSIDQQRDTPPDVVNELKEIVANNSDRYFSDLKPLDASALETLTEKIVVFTTSSVREEMEPEKYRRLITDLDTTDESIKEWKKVFEFLHDTATSSSNAEAFHNEVVRKSKTDTHIKGKVSGSYGIGSGNVSSSYDQTIETDYKDLTTEEKKVVNDLRDSLRSNSIDEGKLRDFHHQKFTGSDFVEGTRPKPWSVYRISSSMLESNLSVAATKTVRLDAVPVSYRKGFSLDQAAAGTPTTLSGLEAQMKADHKSIDDLKAQMKADHESIDDLKALIGEVGSKIPKYGFSRIFVRTDSNMKPDSSFSGQIIDAPASGSVTTADSSTTFGRQVLAAWFTPFFGSLDNWATYCIVRPNSDRVTYEFYPGGLSKVYYLQIHVLYLD